MFIISFRRSKLPGRLLMLYFSIRQRGSEALDVLTGTEITASLRSDVRGRLGNRDKTLSSRKVPPKGKSASQPMTPRKAGWRSLSRSSPLCRGSARDADFREVTLKIVVDSVNIYVVRQVQFHADEYDVQRYRREKHKPKFVIKTSLSRPSPTTLIFKAVRHASQPRSQPENVFYSVRSLHRSSGRSRGAPKGWLLYTRRGRFEKWLRNPVRCRGHFFRARFQLT